MVSEMLTTTNNQRTTNMEPEINATDYSSLADLAEAIRGAVTQLYVDRVWIKFASSRHCVTPSTADHVCKWLTFASEITHIITPQDMAETMPPRQGSES